MPRRRGVVSGARRRRVPTEGLTASAPSPTICSSWSSRAYAAPAAPRAPASSRAGGSASGPASRISPSSTSRPPRSRPRSPAWLLRLGSPTPSTSRSLRATVAMMLAYPPSCTPRELLFSYQYDGYMEADLPCFQRATFLEISSCNDIRLTQLPAGEFSALEMLSLDACSVTDLGTLVALCPRLRELRVIASMSDILVHSPSLQTLHVCTGMVCSCIDIVTPMLRHLEVQIEADTDLSASISAPMVEKLDWDCSFTDLALVFGFWRLETMAFRPTHNHTEEADTCWQHRPVHVLHLQLSVPGQLDDELDFAQEMEKLPVTDFSVLKLTLETAEHVFGALVLRLFGLHQTCAITKRLIVVIPFSHQGRQACPENCPCDEPKNWRCQSISLTRLEEVQIHGFTGEDHEQDLLKLVFRSSPMLNRVTLKLVPGFGGCIQEIYDIFLANPSVKVCVYASNGGLVQRPSMFLS